jgi:hypothetical protein
MTANESGRRSVRWAEREEEQEQGVGAQNQTACWWAFACMQPCVADWLLRGDRTAMSTLSRTSGARQGRKEI